jgi:hypothetical protein
MANRLSHSQIQKFQFCERAWYNHYVERLRPTSIASPLIFGSAIGKTFEHILQAFTNNQVDISIAKDFFDKAWTFQEFNNVTVNLKESINVVYSKSDFDIDFGETPWESLRTKAHLMIDSFITNFIPLLEKVYSTEEEVLLTSGDDSNVGYADAVVKLKGYDKPIVLDFKTASKDYEANSVKESIQLSQYLYTLGDKYNTNLAGYVVFSKNIKKNKKKICKICNKDGSGGKFKTCDNEVAQLLSNPPKPVRCNGEWEETLHPTCSMQIIIDEIPIEFIDAVIDNIGMVNDKINSGEITPDLTKCDNDGYYRPCMYRDLCHKNSMDGLIKLEKK